MDRALVARVVHPAGTDRFPVGIEIQPDQATVGDSVITYSFLLALGLALAGVWVVLSRNDRAPQIFGRRRQRVVKPKPRRES